MFTKKETTPEATQQPRRKKRHFFLLVPIIAYLLLTVGGILGAIPVVLVQYFSVFNFSDGVNFILDWYMPFIGIVLMVCLYCALFEKDIMRSMRYAKHGGTTGNTGKMFLFGILFGFGTNAACILAAWLAGDIRLAVGQFDLPFLAFSFLIVLIQSGAEEILSRGYMQKALQERYGIVTAIAINSIFFGAMHLGNDGFTVFSFLNITMYGIALSLVAYYFDSLWFCIAMHTAWNFTQNLLFGLPNSGLVSESSFLYLTESHNSLIYDATFGVEGGIVVLLIEVIWIVAMIWYKKGRKQAGKAVVEEMPQENVQA